MAVRSMSIPPSEVPTSSCHSRPVGSSASQPHLFTCGGGGEGGGGGEAGPQVRVWVGGGQWHEGRQVREWRSVGECS